MCGVGGFYNFSDGNKALSKSIEKALWRRGTRFFWVSPHLKIFQHLLYIHDWR